MVDKTVTVRFDLSAAETERAIRARLIGMGWLPPEDAAGVTAALKSARGLMEALEPFAALLQPHHANLPDDRPIYENGEAVVTVGDLRAARAALRKAKGEA